MDRTELSPHATDWEELAELDPLWAIASRPSKRFGGWNPEEFFAEGVVLVDALFERIAGLGIDVPPGCALDFGSGVGRTARALAARFERVVGVDIAPTMVRRGQELNADVPNLEFLVCEPDSLAVLGDRRFDLVYTLVVLQHQPTAAAARRCMEELIGRLTEPGLLVFQIPVHIALRNRLLLARRAYKLLHRLGVPADTLYRRLKLHPIRMLHVPRDEVERWVRAAGARVVAVDVAPNQIGRSGTFYVTRA